MDLEIWESILIHILPTLLKQESRCFFAHSTSQRPSTSLSTYSQAPVGLRERLGLVWAGGIIKMQQAIQTLDLQGDFVFHPESNMWHLLKWPRRYWRFLCAQKEMLAECVHSKQRDFWALGKSIHLSCRWNICTSLQRSNQNPSQFYVFLVSKVLPCLHQSLVILSLSPHIYEHREIPTSPRYIQIKKLCGDFPGGPVVKNLPANQGGMGSISALGRSHMPWGN